eukprot:5117667-Amphidinium_carterae.1
MREDEDTPKVDNKWSHHWKQIETSTFCSCSQGLCGGRPRQGDESHCTFGAEPQTEASGGKDVHLLFGRKTRYAPVFASHVLHPLSVCMPQGSHGHPVFSKTLLRKHWIDPLMFRLDTDRPAGTGGPLQRCHRCTPKHRCLRVDVKNAQHTCTTRKQVA